MRRRPSGALPWWLGVCGNVGAVGEGRKAPSVGSTRRVTLFSFFAKQAWTYASRRLWRQCVKIYGRAATYRKSHPCFARIPGACKGERRHAALAPIRPQCSLSVLQRTFTSHLRPH
ncbi:hypothetical protein GCM10022251_64850 [Phytohabitans flavus]|uniref:Uncharacterized protein n=1 Tax=Phytohabitans flavus TaxID=1076124 RepID=A0A6F8XTZ1_9ACTN|nr:hypothetical protein Pflav_037320 [Phytohabitans flavus]